MQRGVGGDRRVSEGEGSLGHGASQEAHGPTLELFLYLYTHQRDSADISAPN